MSGCTRFHTSYWRGERPREPKIKVFVRTTAHREFRPTEPPSAAHFQMMTFGFEIGSLPTNESE
jgi:hypothetical protein